MVLAITWGLGEVECVVIFQSFPNLDPQQYFREGICLYPSFLIIPRTPSKKLNEVSLQGTAH